MKNKQSNKNVWALSINCYFVSYSSNAIIIDIKTFHLWSKLSKSCCEIILWNKKIIKYNKLSIVSSFTSNKATWRHCTAYKNKMAAQQWIEYRQRCELPQSEPDQRSAFTETYPNNLTPCNNPSGCRNFPKITINRHRLLFYYFAVE